MPLIIGPSENYEFYFTQQERSKSTRRTVEWTIRQLKSLRLVPPARVLSVGCGNGVDVLTMRGHGYVAFGVDMWFKEIPGTCFALASGMALPFASGQFDAVISLETIEHIPLDGRARFCDELRRVSTRAILIATPNRFFPVDEHGEPIRLHSPFHDNTLSYKELCAYFPDMHPIAMRGGKYFALERFKRYITPVGVSMVNAALHVFTMPLLHRSALNPHLFVAFIKAPL